MAFNLKINLDGSSWERWIKGAKRQIRDLGRSSGGVMGGILGGARILN